MSLLEDARRYVDLAKSGWTDPTVNPLELLEAVLDEHLNEMDCSYTQDQYDDAIREARDEARVGLLDPDDCSVSEAMDALEKAIDRERREAVANAEKRTREYVTQKLATPTRARRSRKKSKFQEIHGTEHLKTGKEEQ